MLVDLNKEEKAMILDKVSFFIIERNGFALTKRYEKLTVKRHFVVL